MDHTPYTPHPQRRPETSEQLRARIPGWGADLDPADRPQVPKLQLRDDLTGAHWEVPERQEETVPRERSIEHAHLTPVFGTAQPAKGVSGAIRKLSYARFSEGRAAHWLLLVVADRVDAAASHLRSFVTLHPDPVTPTGIRTELTHEGVASRRGRSDARHHVLDPIVTAGPWVAAFGAGAVATRAVARALRR